MAPRRRAGALILALAMLLPALLAAPAAADDHDTVMVTGTIADAAGDPIEGATVQLAHAGLSDTTSVAGMFMFEDATVGPDSLVVSADGFESFQQAVTVQDEPHDLGTFTVDAETGDDPEPDTVMAVGSVENDLGDAVEGATVSLADANLSATTDGNGGFQIDDVPVGDDTLNISAAGHTNISEAVTIGEGTTGVYQLDTFELVELRIDPTNFVVEPGDGELHVSWDAPTDDFSHYELRWQLAGETNWSQVELDDDATEHTIDGLDNGVPYFVEIRSRDGASSSGWINHDGVPPEEADDTPAIGTFVVLDAETTDPIEGATVQIGGESQDTDADGETVITIDSTHDTYSLNIDADGYEPYEDADLGELTAGAEFTMTRELTPQAEPTTGTIDGGVFDTDSEDPIEGADVEVDGTTVTTDGDGLYTVEVDAGTHDITASADGYDGDTETDVEVPAGAEVTVDFSLDAEPTGPTAIDGTVTDADTGEPVDGASVAFSGGSSALLTTGEDGTYNNIGIDATSTTVTVSVHGYEDASETVDVNENETVTVDFELERQRAELTVEVRDDNGDLIDGASASLNGGPFIGEGDGTYFTNLDPGTYEIEVSADGYESDSQTIDPDWGDVVQVFFALDADDPEPQDGEIVGTVTDADTGDPIEGADVNLNTVGVASVTDTIAAAAGGVTTGADGTFAFDDVAPGPYEVVVTADGYEDGNESTGIEAGETVTVDVELDPIVVPGPIVVPDPPAPDPEPEDGEIVGTLVDADTDRPVADVTVTLSGDAEMDTTTDADGAFEFGPLAPGDYTVTVTTDGYDDATEEVEVADGETVTVGIDLEPETVEPDPEPDPTPDLEPDPSPDPDPEPEPEPDDLPEVAVDCGHGADGVAPGDPIDCTVSGLGANQTAQVTVTVNPILLDTTVTADGSGTATFSFDVPATLSNGDEIEVRVGGADQETLDVVVLTVVDETDEDASGEGTTGEDAPGEDTDSVRVVVTDDTGASSTLPRTGSATLQLAFAALLAMMLGAALLRTSRRPVRRHSSR